MLAIHGDKFHKFLKKYPRLSELASGIHLVAQSIGSEQRFARKLKSKAKKRFGEAMDICRDAMLYCQHTGADKIFVGHTHIAGSEQGIYYNSGSCAEIPLSYITLGDLGIRIHYENYLKEAT